MRYHYTHKAETFARKMRKEPTDAEKILWHYLRERTFLGYKFRRQFPLDTYILDFYCPKKKLAIELDGSQHMEQKQIAHDQHKMNFVAQYGIVVIRFSNHDVMKNIHGVLQAILDKLNDNNPTPTLP